MLLADQEPEAIDLVVQAIEAGIFNDLGSGSNVDVCVIREKDTEMLRNYRTPNERASKERSYKLPRGTTAWTREQIYDMVVNEGTPELTDVRPHQDIAAGSSAMDTS